MLLAAQVKLLRQDIQRAIREVDDSSALAELKLAKAVLEGHGPGGDLRKLLKQPMPALLKLLLGQHCNVMTLQVLHCSARCNTARHCHSGANCPQ